VSEVAELDRVMDVEIVGLGRKGDGMARDINGKVIMIPDTKMGDRVRIKIVNVQNKIAFGEVID